MQMDLKGYYLDGQTPLRQRAVVRLTPLGLQITIESGAILCWPYGEIHQTQHSCAGDQIGLERGKKIPEVILVPGPLFLQCLRGMAPEQTRRFRGGSRKRNWFLVALASLLGIMGIVTMMYLWGIPALASYVACHVPVSWEEQLGKSVLKHLAPPERRCQDSTQTRAAEEILATLSSSLPEAPYEFRVIMIDDPGVNAFATPGGTIVVFRGLLERTRTPEELAGVLAHEMQHILHRHATRAILQQASLGLLLAGLTGDTGGGIVFSLEGARVLGMLRYTRQSEEEADRDGMRMLLASKIDPRGMIAFFEGLQKENKKSSGTPTYLSTHPDLGQRVQSLRALAQGAKGPFTKLLPGYDWSGISGCCPGDKPRG